MTNDRRPKYLRDVPPRSDEAMWRELEFEFGELRDLVEIFRLESWQESIARTSPKWNDEDAGGDVDAWLMIPCQPHPTGRTQDRS